MAGTDYEHECLRAELLGLPKPDINEFSSRKEQNTSEGNEDEEMVKADEMDEGIRREGLNRIGGGLEELNSILSSTQRKLNRFKTAFGNFGSLLKIQVGARKEDNEKPGDQGTGGCIAEDQERKKEEISGSPRPQVKKDGNVQLDKLDSLITRAEQAELSLSSQNKQIKKFLN